MKFIVCLLALAIAVVAGACLTWLHVHTKTVPSFADETKIFHHILKHASVKIRSDAYSCEGDKMETVGDVFESILLFNQTEFVNRLSSYCISNPKPDMPVKRHCGIGYSNCQPWQDSECGSRILRVDFDQDGEVITDSFACIDVP